MFANNFDVLTQFQQLSQVLEKTLNIKPECHEAHNIYLELLEVRKKLAEVEGSFPKLN